MKIKICGITEAENARAVSHSGVDALGFNFYKKSPRFVSAEKAREIIAAVAPFVSRVGLFVNPEAGFVDEILSRSAIDTLQFHGDERPEECARYGLPFIKVIRMRENIDVRKIADDYHHASGFLLDAFDPENYGGSGLNFDFSRADVVLGAPVIIAGGLTADNVADATRLAKPYGVDVCSGVEKSPGVKDLAKIRTFIQKIQKAAAGQ